MSGNSCEAPCTRRRWSATLALDGAPGRPRRRQPVPDGGLRLARPHRAKKVSLNLPICSSSPVHEPVRLDPLPVHVGAVQRARGRRGSAVAAAHQRGVLARDGDVVEEDVGRASARSSSSRRERGTTRRRGRRPSGPRAPRLGGDVPTSTGLLAGLVADHVGRRRDVLRLALVGASPLEGARTWAVVGALGDDEAALRTMARHGAPARAWARRRRLLAARPARMSVRRWTSAPEMTSSPPSCFLRSRFTSSARRMSIFPCRIRRRRTPPALVRELLDQVLQLLVGERPQIGEGVHHQSVPLLAVLTGRL